MPYSSAWVEPETFHVYNGVAVFHKYKDDDVNMGRLHYYYTLSSTCDDEEFDVRLLRSSLLEDITLGRLSAVGATQEDIERWTATLAEAEGLEMDAKHKRILEVAIEAYGLDDPDVYDVRRDLAEKASVQFPDT